jgi:hypothetical protein
MKLSRYILSGLLLIAAMPCIADTQKMSELDEQTSKLLAVVNGCELDELCILTMLQELVKTDPNLMFKKYLQISESYKSEVDKNIKLCRTAQTMAYKKELAKCMVNEVKKPGVLGYSESKVEKNMGECLVKNMTPLGADNNMYAQASLAQYALEHQDTKNHQYWSTMLRGQSKSTEAAVFDKCGSGLGLPLKIMNETILSVAKEKGMNKK